MKQCSFDTRSEGASDPPSSETLSTLVEEKSRRRSLMIFCTRTTRGHQKDGKGSSRTILFAP